MEEIPVAPPSSMASSLQEIPAVAESDTMVEEVVPLRSPSHSPLPIKTPPGYTNPAQVPVVELLFEARSAFLPTDVLARNWNPPRSDANGISVSCCGLLVSRKGKGRHRRVFASHVLEHGGYYEARFVPQGIPQMAHPLPLPKGAGFSIGISCHRRSISHLDRAGEDEKGDEAKEDDGNILSPKPVGMDQRSVGLVSTGHILVDGEYLDTLLTVGGSSTSFQPTHHSHADSDSTSVSSCPSSSESSSSESSIQSAPWEEGEGSGRTLMSSDVIGVLVRRMGGSYVVTFFLNGHPILPVTNAHTTGDGGDGGGDDGGGDGGGGGDDGDDGGGGGVFESVPYSVRLSAEFGSPIATASLRGDGTSLLAAFDTLDFRYPPSVSLSVDTPVSPPSVSTTSTTQ